MPEQHHPILIAYSPGQPRSEPASCFFDEAFPVTVHLPDGDTEQGMAYWVDPDELDYALDWAGYDFGGNGQYLLLCNQRKARYPTGQGSSGRRFVNDCTGHEFKE